MIGLSRPRMTCWPRGYGRTSASSSAIVRPETVRQPPCSSPASSRVFIKGLMPPIATSSDIMYRPLGRRSARTGTRLPIRVKSSRLSFTPAECAMASRCNTAFVLPASAMTVVIAFSKARRVMMSDGLMSNRTSLTTASPARRQSSRFARDTASCAELLGRLIPRASMAEAIVLAVYMPPQLPGPGMALHSISCSARSDTAPLAWPPTASNTETTSVCPAPGRIVPP